MAQIDFSGLLQPHNPAQSEHTLDQFSFMSDQGGRHSSHVVPFLHPDKPISAQKAEGAVKPSTDDDPIQEVHVNGQI